jgi:hypothetical protein
MLENFRLTTFSDRIGDTFRLSAGAALEADLVLIQANALSKQSENPASGRAPFSLVFRGPLTPVFPQATYQFSHAMLGVFEMFIVPTGPGEDGMLYEAIFT